MAKKGQKFSKYGFETKEMVLAEIKTGKPLRIISKEYNIPKGTLLTWSHKYHCPEKYPNQGQKRGRPKESELTKEDYKERYEILKKYQAFLKAQRERK